MLSGHVRSLLALTHYFTENKITWAWSGEYSSLVADAREMTMSGDNQNNLYERRPFKGQITYDKILWIDSDIIFTVDDAMRLLDHDKDVVSGAYLLGSGEVTAYPKLLDRALMYEDVLKMTEPIKIAGCGFGFLAVKHGVFESLSRPWFQSVEVETDDGYKFMMMGEDLSWCKRVTDLGYEIWFDPTIRVTHHKMIKLTWEGMRP